MCVYVCVCVCVCVCLSVCLSVSLCLCENYAERIRDTYLVSNVPKINPSEGPESVHSTCDSQDVTVRYRLSLHPYIQGG